MRDDQYTYEDYVRDFELDYLGFDGVPDEPVPEPCPEKITENGPESEARNSGGEIHSKKVHGR